jgi:hypothetical protein
MKKVLVMTVSGQNQIQVLTVCQHYENSVDKIVLLFNNRKYKEGLATLRKSIEFKAFTNEYSIRKDVQSIIEDGCHIIYVATDESQIFMTNLVEKLNEDRKELGEYVFNFEINKFDEFENQIFDSQGKPLSWSFNECDMTINDILTVKNLRVIDGQVRDHLNWSKAKDKFGKYIAAIEFSNMFNVGNVFVGLNECKPDEAFYKGIETVMNARAIGGRLSLAILVVDGVPPTDIEEKITLSTMGGRLIVIEKKYFEKHLEHKINDALRSKSSKIASYVKNLRTEIPENLEGRFSKRD